MGLFESIMFEANTQTGIFICLILAVFRIYLEVINFDFSKLPFTKALAQNAGNGTARSFHRIGLFLSVGYILLFAPGFLLS